MSTELREKLLEAAERGALPAVVAYNRIDGPGSSLDLREFQQAMWRLPKIPEHLEDDPTMAWTRGLPRTVGITIDTGTRVEAHPFARDRIAVQSIDYGVEVQGRPGEVPPVKDNWLLKILELFGLVGVKFVLRNLRPEIHSAGLGGSATATTAVCLLANELANRPFDGTQLVAMASRMEQDLGVSITGTQEQSNVVFGGITDHVWLPWGMPGKAGTGYGSSLRRELVPPERYGEIEQRMAIFHTGRRRASTKVNKVWTDKLATPEGYRLHCQKLEAAYQFREGLRLSDWERVNESIRAYRAIRTELCSAYMNGAEVLQKRAEAHGGTSFPLGAGGGGGVLVFVPKPEGLRAVRADLAAVAARALRRDPTSLKCKEIPVQVRRRGHEFVNLPR